MMLGVKLLFFYAFVAGSNHQQFSLPGRPLTRHPGLQVDGEGRVFVTAGDQLFKLNSDLVPELNVTLSSVAVNISLSSGGEWLVVCTRDLSCAVYNTSDFTLQTRYTSQDNSQDLLGNSEKVAIFTAGDSFYVGSVFTPPEGDARQLGGDIYLRQFSAANISFVRTRDYNIRTSQFERTFYGGFRSGPYSYFIVTDHSPTTSRSIRIMRVCHVTGCPEGRGTCPFTALYEEDLRCGTSFGPARIDGICGVSVMEDFADSAGITLLVTRCREYSSNRNLVCAISLADIDRTIERRFNECMAGRGDIDPAWDIAQVSCRGNEGNFQPMRMCDLGDIAALDDKDIQGTTGVDVLPQVESREIIDIGRDVLNRGSPDPTITASVALKVDNYSLMAVAYTDTRNVRHFRVEIFLISNLMTVQTVSNGFGGQFVSSPVRSLQWQRGLDYVVAATNSEVLKIPVEECASILNCSSCVVDTNPLCGWCVVENKCSRQSQCQDGNSINSTRWIVSNPSADITAQCIVSTVSPDQFILKNEQLLSVSVGGPGLPAKFIYESYLCHFEDSAGRFNITVQAEEIIEGTNYTCNITNLVPPYDGVQAVMHFSFVSSLVGMPFDRTDNALTIYRCNATSSCSECLDTENACGWCVINKLCRGTAEDCTNITNFLQVNTFEDVCSLLDLKGGITNYTQHVRIVSNLQLTTRNLLENMTGFSYTCRIKGINFSAIRNNETSLTCMVDANQLSIPSGSGSEVTDISIIWRGPDIEHTIDTLMKTSVVLYDCMSLARDCSSCVGSRITSDFQCGWCESQMCSIDVECIFPLLTIGRQCPQPIITDFSPSSGPPNGGTLIDIRGSDLGVTFAEFLEDEFDSIAIGGDDETRRVACTPVNMEDYISGKRVFCRTGPGMAPGAQQLFITLRRDSGIVDVYTTQQFIVVLPTLTSVEPSFGPIAGGSTLTVIGTRLNIGNSAKVRLEGAAGAECSFISRTDTVISCITTNTTSPSTGMLSIHIDNQTISKPGVQFEYLSNPNFISIRPTFTIPIGGITVYFIGSNLNVSRNPQLIFNGDTYPCTVENGTALSCIAPNLTGSPTLVMYELRLDNVPPPDPSEPGLQLSVKPNPDNFTLVTNSVSGSEGSFIRIKGENLNSVERSEITVRVGGQPCVISSVDVEAIICQVPMNPELDSDNKAIVDVSVGQNLNYILPQTLLYTSLSSDSGDVSLVFIIPAVAGPVVFILLFCLIFIIGIFCIFHRRGRKKEHQLANLFQQVELLENERARDDKQVDKMTKKLLEELPAKLIISSTQLEVSNTPLGQGQFGVVYKGCLIDVGSGGNETKKVVAVKTLKGTFGGNSDIGGLLSEISKMKDLFHPNVMTLLGICPNIALGPCIVMPYMANGSLLDYLKKERKKLFLDFDVEENQVISVRKLLLRICYQISCGMTYLALQKIIHRDLAARNCMLDSEGNIKVSDFGLSEDVYTTGYFRQSKEDAVRLPFKWMALESLRDGIFSEKTDVWSFGVTCWEVFSTGKTPYPGLDAIDLPKLLDEGMRLDYPTNAANASEIYSIICKCWKHSPDDRPSFKELSSCLEAKLHSVSDYMEIEMVLDQGEESDAYSYPTVTSGGEGLPMQEEIECIGNVAYSTSKASSLDDVPVFTNITTTTEDQ